VFISISYHTKEKMMADYDKQGEKQNTLGPDFMSRLRENITERGPVSASPPPEPPEEVRKYAPPAGRAGSGIDKIYSARSKTRNQTIAEFIIALPYREAMAMGTGIVAKIEGASSESGRINAEALTRAIQNWAWDWETFQDEERPGSKE
jgi:hypothetical protein